MMEAATRLSRLISTIETPQHDERYSYAWAVKDSSERVPEVLLSSNILPDGSPETAVVLWAGTSSSPVADLLEACQGVLSSVEFDRARSFCHAESIRSFLTAHAILRLQLAAQYNCSPEDLHFATGLNGKPYLKRIVGREAHTRLRFNLSHTRGRTLIGLSSAPIGVDVEMVEDFPDMLETANLVFAPESRAALASCSGKARTQLFFRFWTLGEAFIKATGLGISQGLDTFAFTSRGAPGLTRITPGHGPISSWHFGQFGHNVSDQSDA